MMENEYELPQLDEFIKIHANNQSKFPRNSYTKWDTLTIYVRVGPRYLNGVLYEHVIDIANVTADVPGKGVFTRLVSHLRDTYPSFSLYVECVLTARFAKGLERLGFVPTNGNPRCFHILGTISKSPEAEI